MWGKWIQRRKKTDLKLGHANMQGTERKITGVGGKSGKGGDIGAK